MPSGFGSTSFLSELMNTYIALVRGINVAGSHQLPMRKLRLMFEQNGCVGVRTYIQSGNVVFRSRRSDPSRLAKLLTAVVARRCGFEPRVLVLTLAEFEQAAAENPFPEADRDPTSLHLFFLTDRPKDRDLESMDRIRTATERFALKGKVFYLLTPDGFGRSKLAARTERLLGVEATARNWRTVATLLVMAQTPG
jgi:uncharacterized protein (DUF1697 family)